MSDRADAIAELVKRCADLREGIRVKSRELEEMTALYSRMEFAVEALTTEENVDGSNENEQARGAQVGRGTGGTMSAQSNSTTRRTRRGNGWRQTWERIEERIWNI